MRHLQTLLFHRDPAGGCTKRRALQHHVNPCTQHCQTTFDDQFVVPLPNGQRIVEKRSRGRENTWTCLVFQAGQPNTDIHYNCPGFLQALRWPMMRASVAYKSVRVTMERLSLPPSKTAGQELKRVHGCRPPRSWLSYLVPPLS